MASTPTPGAQDQATPEPTASPTIDYSAVLALLNKQRGPATSPSPSPLPTTSILVSTNMQASSPFPASGAPSSINSPGPTNSGQPFITITTTAPAAAATSPVAVSPQQQTYGSPQASTGDASYFPGYGRLDITLGQPAHFTTGWQDIGAGPGSTAAAAATASAATLHAAVIDATVPPRTEYTAAPTANASATGGPNNSSSNTGTSGQPTNLWAPLASVQGLNAAVRQVDDRSTQLETRLRQLESAVAHPPPQLPQEMSPEVAAQLASLKGELSAVAGEQARLRAELSDFTSHTTSLLSKLQTQIHQLFRMSDQQASLGLGGRPAPAAAYGGTGGGLPLYASVDASTSDMQRMSLHAQPQQQQHAPAPSFSQAVKALEPMVPGSANYEQAPLRLQPSRSLFSDLPPTATTPTHAWASASTSTTTAAKGQQQGAVLQGGMAAGGSSSNAATTLRIPPASIPVSTFEDSLALPSYAAMRRSSASITTSLAPSAHRPGSAVTSTPAPMQAAGRMPGAKAAPATTTTTSPQAAATTSNAPAPAFNRKLPGSFEPRTLGASPLLGQGLAAAVAAAGGDLGSLGIQLPTSKLGAAYVGSPADYAASTTDTSRQAGGTVGGPTGSGASGFGGAASAFGVLPEPLKYNMASDFKIVRVGGGAGVGDSGLSLAAQTAAAVRARSAKGA